MSSGSIFVKLNAVFFVVYGLAFVVAPEALGLAITGSAPESPSGMIDLRATYGGMTIALGVMLGWLGRSKATQRLGLHAVALVMLCMASGRVVGLVVDGNANNMMYAFLAAEIMVLSFALWSARSAPASSMASTT